MEETVAVGRAKRSTAGNRMRELLEKAHQQDEEDMFKEEEGDDEFSAPQDQRDVFLDDFADTDDEVELDESDEERAIRREERQRTKGKSKAVYNPLASTVSKPKKVKFPPEPAPSTPLPKDLHLLDPNLDPSQMAPSTLVLALRKKRREQKRLHRDQNLRSNLRASTLRTEEDILEKEKMESENRKGRRAQHEMGEIRVVKQKMTQDELIAAAFEEEERNKEALRDWLRKEEERRELRRVGRKRVRGPRWTWVSRTVGKMVEEVEDPAKEAAMRSGIDVEQTPLPDTVAEPTPEGKAEDSAVTKAESSTETAKIDEAAVVVKSGQDPTHIAAPNAEAGPSRLPAEPEQAQDGPSQYTRNYIILSQIPGGLASELQLVLGDHVEWDRVKFIPHRNRPINRRPVVCPFTGLPARYRHPLTLTPYATAGGYAQIQALLQHRYMWSESASTWYGGEEDVSAEGVDSVPGWGEAVNGGWIGGRELEKERPAEGVEEELGVRKGMKRKFFDEESETPGKVKKGKGKGKGKKGR